MLRSVPIILILSVHTSSTKRQFKKDNVTIWYQSCLLLLTKFLHSLWFQCTVLNVPDTKLSIKIELIFRYFPLISMDLIIYLNEVLLTLHEHKLAKTQQF
jgi:hypothetical protein